MVIGDFLFLLIEEEYKRSLPSPFLSCVCFGHGVDSYCLGLTALKRIRLFFGSANFFLYFPFFLS